MKAFVRKPVVKAIAFILSVLSLVGASFGIMTLVAESDLYTYSGSDGSMTFGTAFQVNRLYDSVDEVFCEGRYDHLAENFPTSKTNMRICLQELSGDGGSVSSIQYNYDPEAETPLNSLTYYVVLATSPIGTIDAMELGYDRSIFEYWQEYEEQVYVEDEPVQMGHDNDTVRYFIMTVGLAAQPQVSDVYTQLLAFANTLYDYRDVAIWLSVGSLLLALAAHIVLLAGAGRRPGVQEAVGGWQEKIPLDLYLILSSIGICSGIGLVLEMFYQLWGRRTYYDLLLLVLALAVAAVALLTDGLLCTLTVRLKLGHWWRNSLLWWIGSRCGKWIRRICSRLSGALRSGIAALPLIWQGVLLLGVALAGEALLSALMEEELYEHGVGIWLLIWLLYNLLAVAGAVYLLEQMKRLAHAGEKLAAGKLDYRVDTDEMLPVFRRHGDNLNAISVGLGRAVEERMRSERMKTELITNVSHDIKTPLTSIVNYVDLLSKEEPENEQSREYVAALQRQSARLRKLIEDLVEASKASTGNLSVDLQPCELGVLLEQTAGEYAGRLEAAALSLVVKAPEQPVVVLADSRHIWRVLDNLMGNICKYALPGTRVYLTLEKGDEAVLTLRNISREELNVSSEELMERFVRGDASRSTEGSGLGLSIAQSLIELQHGSLELQVDGDLFKVRLHMPLLEADASDPPQQPKAPAAQPDETPSDPLPPSGSASGHLSRLAKSPAKWLYGKLKYIAERDDT